MAIFSRMHSPSAALKFRYFGRVANSIIKLFICWLYLRQRYFGGRRRCDRGRCKTPPPARQSRRKPPNDPEGPIADARRRHGRERPGRHPRGSSATTMFEWIAARLRGRGGVRSRQPRRDGRFAGPAGSRSRYWPGPGLFPGGRRRERRECVLYDEYAYITAKRGRRRIGFVTSAAEKTRPGAGEAPIFRGDALLAGEV